MNDRLKTSVNYLIGQRKIFNASDLAKLLGKQKSYISELLTGKRMISEQFVHSFCGYFPEISQNWLLTGEGEMIKQSTPVSPKKTFPLRTDRNLTIQEIPLYDFDASAGLVAIFNDMNAEPVDYLKIPNLPAVDGAIYVRGESMSPLLKSGDIVMYKKKDLTIDNIFWGEIYLLSFNTDGDSYTAVKYIRKSDKPGMVCLASFNPQFAPKEIPMESITALALVKASLTFHTME
ncbi:MAG: S24 family peptidase [Agathobacter sp.]